MTITEQARMYYLEKDANCSESIVRAANDRCALGLDEGAIKLVSAFRICSGTGSAICSCASFFAASYALYSAFDFGAIAMYTTACVICTVHSGIPRK